MGMPADFEQTAFRGREDDGSETTATFIAALNTDWTQDVDVNFRVRFQATSDGSDEENIVFLLHRNINGGIFQPVDGSSIIVRVFSSSNYTEGDATTEQLAGSNAFLAGEMDDVDGGAGDVNSLIDFPAAVRDCEVEYCVRIQSGDVNDGDTIQLRLHEGGASFADGYTEIPTITVNKPSAGGHPAMRRWGGIPHMTPGPHSHSRSW